MLKVMWLLLTNRGYKFAIHTHVHLPHCTYRWVEADAPFDNGWPVKISSYRSTHVWLTSFSLFTFFPDSLTIEHIHSSLSFIDIFLSHTFSLSVYLFSLSLSLSLSIYSLHISLFLIFIFILFEWFQTYFCQTLPFALFHYSIRIRGPRFESRHRKC